MRGWALLLLLAIHAGAAAASPRIHLTSPEQGWTSQRTVRIAGSVRSSERVLATRLVVNGIPQELALHDGEFEVDHLLAPGANEIRVVAADAAGTEVATVRLHAAIPPVDLKVILTWDSPDADVDLCVVAPDGERCDFTHPATTLGGRLDLDVSDGCGPETFSLPHASAGRWTVRARLFAGPTDRPVRCRVDVLLHETTPSELRRTFRTVLLRPGQTAVVAEVDLP